VTGSELLALTQAQGIFVAGLVVVGTLITWFTIYVAWTTVWGNRWYRRGK
jgi:hypothetical protein